MSVCTDQQIPVLPRADWAKRQKCRLIQGLTRLSLSLSHHVRESYLRSTDVDYVKEPGLGSLAAFFGSTEAKPQDSDKLMDLYWNRAELKKAFADSRKERFRLQDNIKRQEGATARLQQKLDHLEDLLIDPQSTHNVVVFYQLRGLALRCERKLAKFAEQLKQQREQKQHSGVMSDWKVRLGEEIGQAEEQLLMQRQQTQQMEDQCEALRRRLEDMGVIQKVFKGRSARADLDRLKQQIEIGCSDETSLLADLAAINERTPPESQGLDISSKRSINLMILAFAQQLYLQFTDRDFAGIVKEASEKSVGSITYGNQLECAQILERIEKHIEIMEHNADFARILRKRATLIGEKAVFRNETEVVPAAVSTSTVFSIDDDGLVTEQEASILGENFWGIAKVLSR